MSLTSDEVNFLIYRYLLESGLIHSAFTFGHESLITKANIDGSKCPPGALISLIQKGLQYSEIETHVNDDGTEMLCDQEFSVLKTHQCNVKNTRKIFNPYEPMEEDFGELEIPYESLAYLKGHEAMVTVCKYQSGGLLATGAADGTIRLWDVRDALSASDEAKGQRRGSGQNMAGVRTVAVMKPPVSNGSARFAVVALDWHVDGSLLVSASFDGGLYVWNSKGELKQQLSGHKSNMSVVKFNPKGDLLCSCSLDGHVIIWELSDHAFTLKQEYEISKGAAIAVDWQSDKTLACGSSDGCVYVWTVGKKVAIKRFAEHQGDVTSVEWSPQGLLASSSDDASVKVWSLESDNSLHDFREHDREVIKVAWSHAAVSGEKKSILASASLDTTVKLWDVDQDKCLFTLSRHTHPVAVLAFSPDGELLATGAYDRLHIWATKDGSLVRTYKADAGINDVTWEPSGQRLVACLSDNNCVLVSAKS